MGYPECEPTIENLLARIEELTEALALTNERLDDFIRASVEVDVLPDTDIKGKLWMKLGIKKIQDMTPEELRALNEKVTARLSGNRIPNKEALPMPSPEKVEELIQEKYKGREGKGRDEAIVMLAKIIVGECLEEAMKVEQTRKSEEEANGSNA